MDTVRGEDAGPAEVKTEETYFHTEYREESYVMEFGVVDGVAAVRQSTI